MLDSPQPTFLMEWKWSCVAYSYIHTYIHTYIYIMCVYIGRQTYKHTIVYVHICIYAHITSHMIWICLKMDWIFRRPKKNEETSGEVNTMWFNGVLKFQTTPNEMTTRILITTQLTVHTEFHFYIHMCFVLYCNVLHGNLLLTRSVLRTKHVWRIQSKLASRRKKHNPNTNIKSFATFQERNNFQNFAPTFPVSSTIRHRMLLLWRSSNHSNNEDAHCFSSTWAKGRNIPKWECRNDTWQPINQVEYLYMAKGITLCVILQLPPRDLAIQESHGFLHNSYFELKNYDL